MAEKAEREQKRAKKMADREKERVKRKAEREKEKAEQKAELEARIKEKIKNDQAVTAPTERFEADAQGNPNVPNEADKFRNARPDGVNIVAASVGESDQRGPDLNKIDEMRKAELAKAKEAEAKFLAEQKKMQDAAKGEEE